MPQKALKLQVTGTSAPSPLAQAVLSRFIATNSYRTQCDSGPMGRMLARYAATGVPFGAGFRPAPIPEFPLGPWPSGDSALARLGISQRDVREAFDELDLQYGMLAALEWRVLAEFFPVPVAQLVDVVIDEGPALAATRFDHALRLYAKSTIDYLRRRQAPSRPALGTLTSMRTGVHRLSRCSSGSNRTRIHPIVLPPGK